MLVLFEFFTSHLLINILFINYKVLMGLSNIVNGPVKSKDVSLEF